MKTRPLKTIARGGLMVLAAVMLFSLIVGASSIPPQPVAAAEGRQFAVMYIQMPDVLGPYIHPVIEPLLPPGGIKVIDLSYDVTAPPNSGEPNDPWAIKPQFSQITITKEVDNASPDLNYYCATGQHFDFIYIRLLPSAFTLPPEEGPYYEIVIEDAVISQVKTRIVYRETQNSDYAHLEDISFRCGIITWFDIGSGNIRSWDLLTNSDPTQ